MNVLKAQSSLGVSIILQLLYLADIMGLTKFVAFLFLLPLGIFAPTVKGTTM